MDLAKDPAKNGKIDIGTINEALIAIDIEAQELLVPRVTRYPARDADLLSTGKGYDVKAPIGLNPKGKNVFQSKDIGKFIESLQQELATGHDIIIDISMLDKIQKSNLKHTLKLRIKDEDLNRIIYIK